jgi:hypothetical protein
MNIFRTTLACAFLAFLCSCATGLRESANFPATELPAAVAFNKEAGRGGHLIVTLRLENGEKVPLLVDTGTTVTCLDQSVEKSLGKNLGSETFWRFGAKLEAGIYASPNLYLGGTPLVTGSNICVLDFKPGSSDANHPIKGILGMDCLRHYCIQLDFAAGKMRFLDPGEVNVAQPGKAFHLTFSYGCPFIHHRSLVGGQGAKLLIQIDTGYNDGDGALRSELFEQEVQTHRLQTVGGVTNAQESQSGWLSKCVWNGQTYTNLLIGSSGNQVDSINLIGLRFLARHLVTLDFPNHTMYLKQISIGPLLE